MKIEEAIQHLEKVKVKEETKGMRIEYLQTVLSSRAK